MQLSTNQLINDLVKNPAYVARHHAEYGINDYHECCMHRALANSIDVDDSCDDRKMAENLFLSAIRQYFPDKETINICSIGPGKSCFIELVMHALVTKIGKVANWFLVDAEESLSNTQFEHLSKAMSPESTVVTKGFHWFSTKLLNRESFEADILIMVDGPRWEDIAKDITECMRQSAGPIFVLWMDCPTIQPTRLIYSQGNYNPLFKLTAEAISTPDIRPLYHFM